MSKRNRGKKSRDDEIFGPKWQAVFKDAVDDCCFLLTRGYAMNSVHQLVGNRYRLNSRQRHALRRMSSSDQAIRLRQSKSCRPRELDGAPVEIDGFNLLILLENVLSGAYVFKCRDSTYRDISSVHGSYKRVEKTEAAIILVGEALADLQPASVKWYFDRPVSNSGRLKTWLLKISGEQAWEWQVETVFNPDKQLADSEAIVITSDAVILDEARRWFNFGAYLIERGYPDANIIDV
ncbi:MAG TPA: DUF434 domain-containing protein [Saprospiraceae bacterium]|nr:DUF434 domain-containing protein [Saprospiraceae bacterium]